MQTQRENQEEKERKKEEDRFRVCWFNVEI